MRVLNNGGGLSDQPPGSPWLKEGVRISRTLEFSRAREAGQDRGTKHCHAHLKTTMRQVIIVLSVVLAIMLGVSFFIRAGVDLAIPQG
jgi:hypothetical protein